MRGSIWVSSDPVEAHKARRIGQQCEAPKNVFFGFCDLSWCEACSGIVTQSLCELRCVRVRSTKKREGLTRCRQARSGTKNTTGRRHAAASIGDLSFLTRFLRNRQHTRIWQCRSRRSDLSNPHSADPAEVEDR